MRSRFRSIRFIPALAFTICIGLGAPLLAQEADPSADATYRYGSLALTPAMVFSSGYDTNVYREQIGFADYETFVVPQIEAWWVQPGFRVTGRAAMEAVSFLNNPGAINGQTGVRFDRTHSLITPWAGWNRRRTNASPTGFEIGYKSLRIENDISGGVNAVLSQRTKMSGLVRIVRTNWDADAIYQTSSLREKLNRDTLGTNATFSYTLTPLTAIGATVETQDDKFKYSPVRDGHAIRVGSVVEFARPAMLFGNAVVGYEHFTSPASGAADFNGMFASANLGYGTADGTLMKLFVNRDLQYSYDPSLAYYVSTGITGTVSRNVMRRWDIAAFGGRYFLDYRPAAGDLASARPVESVIEFGGAAAYRLNGHTRVGFSVERAAKTGADGYDAVRVIGFLTYGSGRFQRLDRPTPFER